MKLKKKKYHNSMEKKLWKANLEDYLVLFARRKWFILYGRWVAFRHKLVSENQTCDKQF